MVVPDLIFSLFVALVIGVVFAGIILRKGPRRGFFWFFLLIFLAIFAAGIWGKPLGAPLSADNWLPFVAAGVLMALLLTFLAPRYPKVKRDAQLDRARTMAILDKIERDKKIAALAYISLSLFSRVAIIVLVAVIIARYLL
ncbi:MAG: hypothetical protein P1P81_10610 [Desulfobulbales bacterium]|nr:hypothetical protein [Desulfobulbales bacterium]